LFTTVSFSLTGSRAFSRAASSTFTPESLGGVAKVCSLPLGLWLPRASGRRGLRQVSRTFGTSLLQGLPFCSRGRGGRSQPSPFSLTGSRALSRAVIYIVTFRMTRRLAQVCKLPLRIWLLSASGRLLAPGLSLIRHCPLTKTSFLFALARRQFTAVPFSLAGSRAFSRVNKSCFYTRTVSCGLLRSASYP
jgi:hypothetical protein